MRMAAAGGLVGFGAPGGPASQQLDRVGEHEHHEDQLEREAIEMAGDQAADANPGDDRDRPAARDAPVGAAAFEVAEEGGGAGRDHDGERGPERHAHAEIVGGAGVEKGLVEHGDDDRAAAHAEQPGQQAGDRAGAGECAEKSDQAPAHRSPALKRASGALDMQPGRVDAADEFAPQELRGFWVDGAESQLARGPQLGEAAEIGAQDGGDLRITASRLRIP